MQILFGMMDALVYLLVNLVAQLEGGDDFGVLLCGSHHTNSTVSSLLDNIFSNELFWWVRAVGLLDTHCILKGATFYTAHFGMI